MAKPYKIQARNGSVRRHQMKEIAPGHHRSTDVGGVSYSADVFIDFDMIGRLANQAALSKGGKCKSGPVLIKITKRQDIP